MKTDGYSREQVGRVVQVRANVEGLKLGAGVLERLAEEGDKGSLRYVYSGFRKFHSWINRLICRN